MKCYEWQELPLADNTPQVPWCDAVFELTVVLALRSTPRRLAGILRELGAMRPTKRVLLLLNEGPHCPKIWDATAGPPPQALAPFEDLAHAMLTACETVDAIKGRVLFLEDDCFFPKSAQSRAAASAALAQLFSAHPRAPVVLLGCVPVFALPVAGGAVRLFGSGGTHAMGMSWEARRAMISAIREPPFSPLGRKRDIDSLLNRLFFGQCLMPLPPLAFQEFKPTTANAQVWDSGGNVLQGVCAHIARQYLKRCGLEDNADGQIEDRYVVVCRFALRRCAVVACFFALSIFLVFVAVAVRYATGGGGGVAVGKGARGPG